MCISGKIEFQSKENSTVNPTNNILHLASITVPGDTISSSPAHEQMGTQDFLIRF